MLKILTIFYLSVLAVSFELGIIPPSLKQLAWIVLGT